MAKQINRLTQILALVYKKTHMKHENVPCALFVEAESGTFGVLPEACGETNFHVLVVQVQSFQLFWKIIHSQFLGTRENFVLPSNAKSQRNSCSSL